MDINHFKKYVKEQRREHMPTMINMVESALKEVDFNNKNPDTIITNPSDFILKLREKSWKEFQLQEDKFSKEIMGYLIEHDNLLGNLELNNLTPQEMAKEIIIEFFNNYSEHMYALNLSNTQSRRARAGGEFEIIFYKLLSLANIEYDEQGVVGSPRFKNANLGKLVDCVVPGVIEYNINKSKCSLISMKTSLRERWQEVPEEISRTGAQSMFLFTLDHNISEQVINSLYGHNVYLVVLDGIKEEYFSRNNKVYSLRKLLNELKIMAKYWHDKEPHEMDENYFNDKVKLYEEKIQQANNDTDIKTYYNYKRDYQRQKENIKRLGPN